MASVGKRCPSLSVGRSIGTVFMVTSALFLASCNSATVNTGGTGPGDLDVLDKVRSLDILPRYPTQAGSTTTSSGPRAQPVVFQGTEITDIAEPRPQPAAGGNGFDLNFESAPVATVAKVVLGDTISFLSCTPNSPLLYANYHLPLFGTNSYRLSSSFC